MKSAFAKTEREWRAHCLDRDGRRDALSGQVADHVHHIIPRRWVSVKLFFDNGLAVSAGTHKRIHDDEAFFIRYVLRRTNIVGFVRYSAIIDICNTEVGFADTLYFKEWLKWRTQ